MKNIIKKYCLCISASILPLTAVMLPLIMGMTGVGVDASMWMMQRRDLQTAADAAVIAAAWEIANDFEQYAEPAALREAENNGFDSALPGSDLDIDIGTDDQGRVTVTASLQQEASVYFSGILFHGEVFTGAAAASAVIDFPGDFCLLSLDEEADGAITAVGAVEIDSEGCGIAVNSNSDSALDLTGNVDINIGSVNIVGDAEVGGSVDFEYGSLDTNSSKTQDPYEDLETPDYDDCDHNNLSINSDTTLSPGVYCGGIDISGNVDIEFEPGVYIIDGGDFSVSGSGSLSGEGVSFILTSSSGDDYGLLDITGSKDVHFTAPAEGEDMQGVVFYRDREAPEDNQCNTMTGTSSIILEGAAYFPTGCFKIGGNHDSDSPQSSPCTRIIAKTIQLHGNPSLGNNCEGVAVEDMGQISVRLIM